jgi:hypothetical protein
MLPTYTRYRRYAQFQSDNPDTKINGADMDVDYDRIKTVLDAVVAGVADVRRDDGAVKNASIGADQLKSEVLTLLKGVTPKGDWVTATAYSKLDLVRENNILYFCLVAHTSGTFATDLAAGKWMMISAGTSGANVVNVPAGNIAADNVQDAINELDTEKQATTASLTSLAGLATTADKMAYLSDVDTWALTALTAAARTLLGKTTSADMLTTLGALPLAGGTMTGDLTLKGNPDADLKAATKQYVDSTVGAPRSYLAGLTLSTAGSSATFSVAAGVAVSSTNDSLMTLASALSKTTGAWAAGASGGALDTGTIANSTWYHVYLIKRTDSGAVDVLVSTDASNPTMPTGYTQKRRIGSMLTDGSAKWTAFSQVGDVFYWSAAVLDLNAVSLNTTHAQYTISVPPGISVEAFGELTYVGGGSGDVLLTSPLQPVVTSITGSSRSSMRCAGTVAASGITRFMTDTAAHMNIVVDFNCSPLYWTTEGWVDRRGRDA